MLLSSLALCLLALLLAPLPAASAADDAGVIPFSWMCRAADAAADAPYVDCATLPLSGVACSTTCGAGTREREVACVSAEDSAAVDAEYCPFAQPAASVACYSASSCTGAWGCPAAPGSATLGACTSTAAFAACDAAADGTPASPAAACGAAATFARALTCVDPATGAPAGDAATACAAELQPPAALACTAAAACACSPASGTAMDDDDDACSLNPVISNLLAFDVN